MAIFKDAQGNDVEAYTKEEVEAQVVSASTSAVEDFKKNNPPKQEHVVDPKITETITSLQRKVGELQLSNHITKYTGGDAEKVAKFKSKFERLQGYEDTEAGLAERAADAARLAFGDVASLDVSHLAAPGGKGNGGGNQPPSEDDKLIKAALGITPDDVAKYGAK